LRALAGALWFGDLPVVQISNLSPAPHFASTWMIDRVRGFTSIVAILFYCSPTRNLTDQIHTVTLQ
jgi:hypothetical protein